MDVKLVNVEYAIRLNGQELFEMLHALELAEEDYDDSIRAAREHVDENTRQSVCDEFSRRRTTVCYMITALNEARRKDG